MEGGCAAGQNMAYLSNQGVNYRPRYTCHQCQQTSLGNSCNTCGACAAPPPCEEPLSCMRQCDQMCKDKVEIAKQLLKAAGCPATITLHDQVSRKKMCPTRKKTSTKKKCNKPKRRNKKACCKKGKPCGRACIPRTRKCHI